MNPIDSQKQFRYFIQQNSSIDLSLEKITNTVDVVSDYVPNGEYFYIEYSSELNSHRNLFNRADEIVFSNSLRIIKTDYVFSDANKLDTSEVYVHTADNSIWISLSSGVISEEFGREYEFDVGEQIFHMYKGKDNQWRIFEWYEKN